MKLCWDNIENVRLTRNGNLRDVVKRKIYIINTCLVCGDEYIGRRGSKHCSIKCANTTRNLGRKMKEEFVQKLKDGRRSGKNNPMYGKHHTKEAKEKMRIVNIGNKNAYKGGYRKKKIATYDTYAPQLEWCEKVRRNQEDINILEVKCFKCGEWFVPTIHNTKNRIQSLKGNYKGANYFYCSDNCKNSCSVYGKSPERIMRDDAIRAGRLPWLELTREVQPELRSMVLERDGNQCVKCGIKYNLQCHHIDPVVNNPIESADMDNCITLCKDCHKEVHQKDGCRYNQLRGC